MADLIEVDVHPGMRNRWFQCDRFMVLERSDGTAVLRYQDPGSSSDPAHRRYFNSCAYCGVTLPPDHAHDMSKCKERENLIREHLGAEVMR